jgi:hypothetical protein
MANGGVSPPARGGGKSGKAVAASVLGPPFYAVQQFYLTAPLKTYGWAPGGDAYLVQVFYAPPDMPRGRVAGMVSVPTEDLSEYFDDGSYRVGVAMDRVKSSIAQRVDAAKKLIADGGSGKLADTPLGRQSLEHLEQKTSLLERAMTELDALKRSGWTHIIVVTGWQELSRAGDVVDHLDLNDDFFARFYPLEAFPLAGLTAEPTLVNRDYFIRELLPRDFDVEENRIEGLLVTSPKYPRLKITFNLVRWDLLDKGTGKKSKLGGKPTWPTVEDVANQVILDLSVHWYGKDGDRARRKAYQKEAWLIGQEEKLRKRKKNKEADKYEEAREKIDAAIGKGLVKEHDKLRKRLDAIADPRSGDLLPVSKELLQNLADQQRNASLDSDQVTQATSGDAEKMSQLWADRGTKQAEALKKINPLSNVYFRKASESFNSIARSELLGNSDASGTMVTLSSDFVVAMVKIIDHPGWHGEKFWKLFNTNRMIGENSVLPEAKRTLAQSKNLKEMERQYSTQPSLKKNRYLITLIKIHVQAFGQQVPEYMLNNAEVSALIEEIKRQAPHPLELPEYTVDKSSGTVTIDPQDPNRVK